MTDAASRVARLAYDVQAATAPPPASFLDLDPQTRRQVEAEARWRDTTPEAHYREALAAREATVSRTTVTDDVVAQIRSRR